MSAVRIGAFKLIMNLNTGDTRLFNVVEDIGEQKDLSRVMSDKSKDMKKRLLAYLKAVDAEDIKDMRAARRAELQRHLEKAEKEGNEKRAAAHRAAIKRLERSVKLVEW